MLSPGRRPHNMDAMVRRPTSKPPCAAASGFWRVYCLAAILLAPGGCAKPKFYRADIQSEDPGDRILAIRAAGEAGDRKAVPHLVDRLDDEDDGVRFFAILALERITGSRLGYHYAASSVERTEAVERWREYVRDGRHQKPSPKAVASDTPPAGGNVEGGAAPR